LVYGTGGLAYGRSEVNTNFTSALPFAFPASASETKVGFAVGAGIEYAFALNWSAKIEGLYYDLGRITASAGCSPAPCAGGANGFIRAKDFDLQGGIVRAGLNYKFAWGPVVAKY
jgi:outer membrane immunogenic protein